MGTAMPRVILVADDLTGALDCAGPFAGQGHSSVVATHGGSYGAALDAGAEVVALNTGTRESSPADAVAAIHELVPRLKDYRGVLFKKVDSRLKGHAGTETAALLDALGFDRALIAPAVPELGRHVREGLVVGHGVDTPIPITEIFRALGGRMSVPETTDQAAMLTSARRHLDARDRVLMVGARSLAAALAASMTPVTPTSHAFRRLPGPTVFVVGSRDPITLEQVRHLRTRFPSIAVDEAPDGHLDTSRHGVEAAHLFLVAPGAGASPRDVARRFCASVAARLAGQPQLNLVVCGGETAAELLGQLSIDLVYLFGDVVPGVPLGHATARNGKKIAIATKSGGFGNDDTLTFLAEYFDARA